MILLLALVLAVPQDTWIVDANNGPGTNFTDLPPAVAAAVHGDTILVRSFQGTYSAFQVTGKALTIRGEGAANSRIDSGSVSGSSSVGLVPSGSLFRIEGLSIDTLNLHNGSMAVLNSQLVSFTADHGSVAAARCSFRGGLGMYTGYGRAGTPGIQLTNSSLLVANRSSFVGGSAAVSFCPSGAPGGPAIEASDSRMLLSSCSATGGQDVGLAQDCTRGESGVTGINLVRSNARIAGEAADVIQTGTSSPSSFFFFGAAIVADVASSVVVHGGITLRVNAPFFAGPIVTGPVTLGAPSLPRVAVTGTTQPDGEIVTANPVTVAVDSALPNAPLVLGFTTTLPAPIDLSPFALGEVMLPLSEYFLSAATDGAGQFQVTFPGVLVPWHDVPVFGQGAVLDVAANQVRMSGLELRLFRP